MKKWFRSRALARPPARGAGVCKKYVTLTNGRRPLLRSKHSLSCGGSLGVPAAAAPNPTANRHRLTKRGFGGFPQGAACQQEPCEATAAMCRQMRAISGGSGRTDVIARY